MRAAIFRHQSWLFRSPRSHVLEPISMVCRGCSQYQVLTPVRYASRSSRTPEQNQDVASIARTQGQSLSVFDRQRQIKLAKEAFLALKRKQAAKQQPATSSPRVQHVSKKMEELGQLRKSRNAEEDKEISTPLVMDSEDLAHRRFIVSERSKILKPGIWTIIALLGSYGLLAYFDAKGRNLGIEDLQKPHPHQLPQSWILTPTVIIEGMKAAWKDLDKLTIGFAVVAVLIQCTQRSRVPFWELLLHVPGEKRYTAFTYPLAHTDWQHLGQNLFVAFWFLPSVVQLFDRDLYHTAAFCVSVPLITSFVDHLVFRWTRIQGIPINIGASGTLAAVFGAFCMAYPHEKVWIPVFLILRLDAMYWAGLFAFQQISTIYPSRNTINRPAVYAHLLSASLGAAYIYFDGKDRMWIPLVACFTKQPSKNKLSENSEIDDKNCPPQDTEVFPAMQPILEGQITQQSLPINDSKELKVHDTPFSQKAIHGPGKSANLESLRDVCEAPTKADRTPEESACEAVGTNMRSKENNDGSGRKSEP